MTEMNNGTTFTGSAQARGRGDGTSGRVLHPIPAGLAALVLTVAAATGAAAAQPEAAKPVKTPGPRAAALLVPSNTNFKLTPKLERDTGFAAVTQPSVGVYCFAPKKGVKIRDAVPNMTVDFVQSLDNTGMVQWLSDATRFGCKTNEIGAITLVPDGGGVVLRSNLVAFSIVVD